MVKTVEQALGDGRNDAQIIAEAIKKIDQGLTADWRRGADGDYFWQCVVGGELSKFERQSIAHQYLEAGWGAVTSKTSSENGERPGLTMFSLFVKSDSKFKDDNHNE